MVVVACKMLRQSIINYALDRERICITGVGGGNELSLHVIDEIMDDEGTFAAVYEG